MRHAAWTLAKIGGSAFIVGAIAAAGIAVAFIRGIENYR